MRHLHNIACHLCQEFLEDGFEGIEFCRTHVDPVDIYDIISLGADIADAWARDYVCFQLTIYEDQTPTEAWGKALLDRFIEDFGRPAIAAMGDDWTIYLDGRDIEIYRRPSAWHDFSGAAHEIPLDPLIWHRR